MLNLLKKNTTTFPDETEEGNVYIERDKLFYDDYGYQESVDLSILQYAYVEILGDRPFLFLFDYQQRYISCLQKGFANAYTELSKRFAFDDILFFKTIKSKKEQKHRIFIKQRTKNYEILKEQYNDFAEGYEVLCTPSKFVSWDTNYTEIKRLGIGHSYVSTFEIDYYKIDYPVRIGSLVIHEMEFCDDNDRKEIAVQNYFATLNNDAQDDNSYKELRQLWMHDIPTRVKDAGYERKDQKYLSFDMGGVSISICYTYDADQYDDGNTAISISNYRDYDYIILKERDDLKEDFTEILKFKSLLQFNPNYQNNSKVTSKPKLIEEKAGHRQTLYFNKETNRFGFTSDQFAIEYAIEEVDEIIIQNVLPAKGAGYTDLSVKTKNNAYGTCIFYANQNELDEYATSIEKMLGIKVSMPEPYYNC